MQIFVCAMCKYQPQEGARQVKTEVLFCKYLANRQSRNIKISNAANVQEVAKEVKMEVVLWTKQRVRMFFF